MRGENRRVTEPELSHVARRCGPLRRRCTENDVRFSPSDTEYATVEMVDRKAKRMSVVNEFMNESDDYTLQKGDIPLLFLFLSIYSRE